MIRHLLLPLSFLGGVVALGITGWAVVAPVPDWKLAGPFGGTATTIVVDPENPSVLLAGGLNSLLFRTRDSGAEWELLDFPKKNLSEITSVLVDPADSKHYLAGTIAAEGGGLFESHDEGRVWASVRDIRDFGVRALTAAPSKPSRFIAGTLRGVMLSDDAGKTWTRISDTQNLEMQGITAVAVDTKDADVIYAGTAHLPWKTTDGGRTWASIHTGMIDDSDVFSIYVNPAAPADVLASACSGIYVSSDRGDMWRKLMGIPNSSRRTHVIRRDPSSGEAIFAGTTTGLFKSIDRGTTWRTLTSTQVNALTFDPARPGGLYLAMAYEGIGKSSNGGEAIQMVNNGFVDRSIGALTRSGNRLFALETQNGESSGVFVSADRGESWTQLRNVRGLGGVHLKAMTGMSSDDRILLAASSHQMYKSIDAGVTWKPIPIRLVVTLPPPAATSRPRSSGRARGANRARVTYPAKPRVIIREISPSDINALYSIKNGPKDRLLAATDLGLLKSDDAGEHWTLADIPGSFAVTAVYVAPVVNDRLIARGAGALFVSKDSGDHWTEFRFPLPVSDINDVAIPANEKLPMLVATRVGLYTSPDQGGTWYANQGGIPASTVASVLYTGSERTAYATEYGQLYQSTDAGASWSLVPTAVPSLRIRQLWAANDTSNRLFAITTDLGILFRN